MNLFNNAEYLGTGTAIFGPVSRAVVQFEFLRVVSTVFLLNFVGEGRMKRS